MSEEFNFEDKVEEELDSFYLSIKRSAKDEKRQVSKRDRDQKSPAIKKLEDELKQEIPKLNVQQASAYSSSDSDDDGLIVIENDDEESKDVGDGRKDGGAERVEKDEEVLTLEPGKKIASPKYNDTKKSKYVVNETESKQGENVKEDSREEVANSFSETKMTEEEKEKKNCVIM